MWLMIKRDYSVSVIKANEGGGAQYRHFSMTTKSIFKKSIKEIYSNIYEFLDNDKDYVIISLSKL
tara:strand:- start:540 stop:734 length:195 start_codon:yes stop_codon:yes gene_type:complete